MITSLDKVDNEIEIWKALFDDHIVRLYEIIDDPDHDYLYLISELGDMGTIMTYNEERHFIRNQTIITHLTNTLNLSNLPKLQ